MTGAEYAFIDKQIQLLGDSEPLDVLASTERKLRELVDRQTKDLLYETAYEGKWRPIDILAHLADVEWVFGYRARNLLCDEQPKLTPIDQDRWVAAQRGHRREPEELVASFGALRREAISFYRRLTPDDMERGGEHVGAGMRMSVGFIMRLQAGHDLLHLRQLSDYLQVIADG